MSLFSFRKNNKKEEKKYVSEVKNSVSKRNSYVSSLNTYYNASMEKVTRDIMNNMNSEFIKHGVDLTPEFKKIRKEFKEEFDRITPFMVNAEPLVVLVNSPNPSITEAKAISKEIIAQYRALNVSKFKFKCIKDTVYPVYDVAQQILSNN